MRDESGIGLSMRDGREDWKREVRVRELDMLEVRHSYPPQNPKSII